MFHTLRKLSAVSPKRFNLLISGYTLNAGFFGLSMSTTVRILHGDPVNQSTAWMLIGLGMSVAGLAGYTHNGPDDHILPIPPLPRGEAHDTTDHNHT